VSEQTHQPGQGSQLRKLGAPTQRERKVRAYGVFLDLLDAGEYMREELKAQMLSFGLTTKAFRVLELIFREGPTTLPTMRRTLRVDRRNLSRLVRVLKARGLAESSTLRLPPVPYDESQVAKSRRGIPRRGREVTLVRLTKGGERLMGEALPRQMKLVLALMRALDWREMQTLSNICRKLSKGNVLRLLEEMEWEDAD
jgi:hypothetical protein